MRFMTHLRRNLHRYSLQPQTCKLVTVPDQGALNPPPHMGSHQETDVNKTEAAVNNVLLCFEGEKIKQRTVAEKMFGQMRPTRAVLF